MFREQLSNQVVNVDDDTDSSFSESVYHFEYKVGLVFVVEPQGLAPFAVLLDFHEDFPVVALGEPQFVPEADPLEQLAEVSLLELPFACAELADTLAEAHLQPVPQVRVGYFVVFVDLPNLDVLQVEDAFTRPVDLLEDLAHVQPLLPELQYVRHGLHFVRQPFKHLLRLCD